MNDAQLKALMIRAAKAAGKMTKGHGAVSSVLKSKGTLGIVTKYDKQAEQEILRILAPAGFSVIAEESGDQHKRSPYCWVIDPIDGTTNFSRGSPNYCVSIGLLKNDRSYMGVIYNPSTDELFFAQKGKGAYLNGKRLKLKVAPAYVVTAYDKGHGTEAAGFYRTMGRVATAHQSVRTFGSATIGLCALARGWVDVYIAPGASLWDVAAGIVIAEEAGAKVSGWDGKPWTKDTPLLVVNPSLQKEYVGLLRNA